MSRTYDLLAGRNQVLLKRAEVDALPDNDPSKECQQAVCDLFMAITERDVRRHRAIAQRRNEYGSQSEN
jgi:hypothetical protein